MRQTHDTPPTVAALPGRAFNFAQHLMSRNAGRAAKAAFIDDQGTLTYGELWPSACAAWPPGCARWASSARSACCC
jgi:hypothetical protein